MNSLERLALTLDNEDINLDPKSEYAAVAIILNDDQIIIERRSSSLKDPWSGQFALPGGHYKQSDVELLSTVRREVAEETGVALGEESNYLGYFGPFAPNNRNNLQVFAFVFWVPRKLHLIQSSETDLLKWTGVDSLKIGKKEVDGNICFEINEGLIWGLTARIITSFLSRL